MSRLADDFPTLLAAPSSERFAIAPAEADIARVDRGVRQLEALKNVAATAASAGDGRLAAALDPLLARAREAAAVLHARLDAAIAAFDELARWLGEDPAKTDPPAVFGAISAFLAAVRRDVAAAKERAARAAAAEARKARASTPTSGSRHRMLAHSSASDRPRRVPEPAALAQGRSQLRRARRKSSEFDAAMSNVEGTDAPPTPALKSVDSFASLAVSTALALRDQMRLTTTASAVLGRHASNVRIGHAAQQPSSRTLMHISTGNGSSGRESSNSSRSGGSGRGVTSPLNSLLSPTAAGGNEVEGLDSSPTRTASAQIPQPVRKVAFSGAASTVYGSAVGSPHHATPARQQSLSVLAGVDEDDAEENSTDEDYSGSTDGHSLAVRHVTELTDADLVVRPTLPSPLPPPPPPPPPPRFVTPPAQPVPKPQSSTNGTGRPRPPSIASSSTPPRSLLDVSSPRPPPPLPPTVPPVHVAPPVMAAALASNPQSARDVASTASVSVQQGVQAVAPRSVALRPGFTPMKFK